VRTLRRLTAIFILAIGTLSFADQVTLKNGDRLTGTIVKSDQKTLLMKTEFAGDVSIDWAAVQQVTTSEPLHVSLENGETVVGPVTTEDGNFSVATANQGAVTTPKTAVKALRNESEQVQYEQSIHPRFTENWAGGINLGFALTRGNSQTKNLSLAFTADRKTMHDHLGLYATSVYATDDAPGSNPSTTANAIQSGIRYDHDFDTRLFGFVGGDFQTDALQSLDLRSVFTGGLGVHVIKNDATTLDLLGGLNYTRENYSTFSRDLIGATIGEELTHKLGKATLITEKLYIYPDLSDTGEYRGVFNFGTVTKMNKWLGWQNAVADTYVTNPPLGKKQNDVIFTTGLNISFTH
jgi:putative salt-induced outer membrane protein YdiY